MNFYIVPGLIRPKKAHTSDEIADIIEQTVCKYFKLTKDDLKRKTRRREIVMPRQICMFLLGKFTNHSLVKIGRYFNGKDHTTVIYSLRTVQNLIDTDDLVRNDMERILELLETKLTFIDTSTIIEKKVKHFS